MLRKINMKESAPKLNRDKLLKEKKLTQEQLEKLLEVKISQGTTWDNIKTYMKSNIWLRFIVTKDFNVYVDTSNDHEGIMEDNAIEIKNCIIGNGLLREDDDGSLVFSYQSSPTTILHIAVEKKIIKFFEERGIMIDKNYKHAHSYD